tara:strand:+ start:10600 stop:12195 length:1596 start_codon:yes stop_codon:yes gene_type:complete
MQSGFEERLKKALAGRSPAQLNEFQFLNLEMVKAETGDRWIDVRKKIYGVAAHFVEKRMQADDVVVRCRGGFILIFAHLSGEDARARLEVISRELNLFFLGDRILKNLEISSTARNVDAAEFAQFIQTSANVEQGDAAEGERRRADVDNAQAANNADWVHGDSNARSEARLSPEERFPVPEHLARWVGGESRPHSADSGLTPEDRRAAGQASARFQDRPDGAATPGPGVLRSVDGTRQHSSRKAGWRDAVERASEMDEPGLPEAVFVESKPHWDDIVFKPCWDATLNAITSNICLARRIKDGAVYYGRDTLMGSDALDLHCALDRAVAIAAQRGYQQVYVQGESCNVCIPVHYDTIRSVSDRISYFSILQVVPQHLRRRFWLRVDNIPAGAPISQMQELFRSMKCFGSNLLASIPFDQADLSRFDGCGVDIFGSELPAARRSGSITEDEIAALSRRAKAAGKMTAASFLTRVDGFDSLVAGVSAGVRVFVGEAVGPETALPVARRDAPFAELLQRAEDMRDIERDLLRGAG